MKKIIVSVVLAFLVSPCFLIAQKDNEEPYMTKSLVGESIKNVVAETSGGSIAVNGGHTGDARIEVYVRENGRNQNPSKEEIRKRLYDDYNLDISVSGGKLTATAKSKTRIFDWKRSLSISFKIYVPQDVSSVLNTSGGSISLNNLNGTQDFKTSGGSLHVDGLSGNAKGRTSGGSIHVSDSKDVIDLSTSGGSIEAKNCNGNVRLSTSGGSLRLNELNGTINATTSGGSINGESITGDLDTHTSGGSINLTGLSCTLEASTSGGRINVTMDKLGKYVRLRNSGGNIDLTLPSKGMDLDLNADKISTTSLNNFSGKIEDDSINGKLNGGGVPVAVKTSGRLNLTIK